jgi:uncharacterized RmlC-like cupin family protein
MAEQRIRRISRDERVDGPSTAGMDRFTAFESDAIWAGGARTQPAMVSGWHHHGEQDTVIYVLSGVLRMEFGPDGAETFDVDPGDFVHVPVGAIHREGNPSDEPADLIAVRVGPGPSVVNVDGPAEA